MKISTLQKISQQYKKAQVAKIFPDSTKSKQFIYYHPEKEIT